MSIYISSGVLISGSSGDFREDGPLIGYRTRITFDNITADEEEVGFPVTNLSNETTSEMWKGTSTDPQYITVDLGAALQCDYIGIARHNLGSTGATIQVEVSSDGATWDEHADAIAPTDDSPLMQRFDREAHRYWRLAITPGSEAPEMAVLYLGLVMVLQRNIYGGHTPIRYSYENTSSVGISESGQFLGAVARRANPTTQVTQKNLTAAWARSHMAPFLKEAVGMGTTARRIPFFFAWRPTSYPLEVGFGWIPPGSAPTLTNQGTGVALMDAAFSFQGVV